MKSPIVSFKEEDVGDVGNVNGTQLFMLLSSLQIHLREPDPHVFATLGVFFFHRNDDCDQN